METIEFINIRVQYDGAVVNPRSYRKKQILEYTLFGLTIAACVINALAWWLPSIGNMDRPTLITTAASTIAIFIMGILAFSRLPGRIAYGKDRPPYTDFLECCLSAKNMRANREYQPSVFILGKNGIPESISLKEFLEKAGCGISDIHSVLEDWKLDDLYQRCSIEIRLENEKAEAKVTGIQEQETVKLLDRLRRLIKELTEQSPDTPPIAAVDFDGVLADCEWPAAKNPNLTLMEGLIDLRENAGLELILWTSRTGEPLEAAVNLCAENGLTFDAVNDDTPKIQKRFGRNQNHKVTADIYIDDRAYTYRFRQEATEKKGSSL